MKTIIVYKTISGFTKKYAEWIAEKLKADIYERKKINFNILKNYDLIIYGGPLHAVGISGVDIIKNNLKKLKDKKIIIFATGASPYTKELVDELTRENFNDEEQKQIKFFYLRGGFDLNKLTPVYKKIMTLFKLKLSSKKNKTPEEEQILAAYSNPGDFTKKENLKDLFEYVNSLKK